MHRVCNHQEDTIYVILMLVMVIVVSLGHDRAIPSSLRCWSMCCSPVSVILPSLQLTFQFPFLLFLYRDFKSQGPVLSRSKRSNP